MSTGLASRRTGVLAGRGLRGSTSALAGLALVLALGGGTAIGSAVIAHRTDRAYPGYVERAEVAEVTINPGVWSTEMDAAIRGFTGVTSVHSHTMLVASAADTKPTTIEQVSSVEQWVQTFGSVDGRYVDVDRPTVTSGRLPSNDHEVFVSNGYRSTLEQIEGRSLHPGDTIDLAFWWNLLLDGGVAPGETIAPIGVEQVRIAGFGTFANEVLPDELFPRQQLLVSADLTQQYSCMPTLHPDMTLEDVGAAVTPPTCSSQYWFYSLNLAAGVSTESIRDQFSAAADRLNEDELPRVLLDQQSTHFYIGQDRSDLDDAVRRTTRPTVTALFAFGGVAAISTLTIIGLLVARTLRRQAAAQRDLLAIGATRAQRSRWTAAPLACAVAVGVCGALAVALLLSPIGPLGSVRDVDPSPGFGLPLAIAVPTALALFVAAFVVIAVLADRSARRAGVADQHSHAATWLGQSLALGSNPSATTGITAATGRTRAGADVAVLLGCVVAIVAGTTVLVFGSNLSTLVSHPQSYGWPWDVSVITGGGFGYADTDAVAASLEQPGVHDDVAEVSYFAFDPSSYLGERTAPVVFGFGNAADTSLPILSGRAPQRVGEGVIGSDTAAQLRIRIGDQLTASSTFGEQPFRVVGIAVMPSAGQFVADRTGLGIGAFILVDDAPSGLTAMVGIRLHRGVDANAFVARLGDITSWDGQGAPIVHTTPVRPPEIINVSDLRSAPMILGGMLIVGLAAGLSLAVATSVRDRRRELAILRALGFSDRDLHRSVHWQAITVIAVGTFIGVPLGVIVGRFAWRRFAELLGVVPTGSVPFAWLAIAIVGTAALALAATAPPSRSASRHAVAGVLHTP